MINLCDEVGNLASEGADEQDRVGSLPAKEKLWCWGYGVADFGDDSGRLNTFALSLEIEEDTVAECGEQHSINVRKSDVVSLVEECRDFSSECYRLDAPNTRTEMDVAFHNIRGVLGIRVRRTDESDNVAFDMLSDGDLRDKTTHLIECFGIRNFVNSDVGTGCGAA